jgi:hypothetical protein
LDSNLVKLKSLKLLLLSSQLLGSQLQKLYYFFLKALFSLGLKLMESVRNVEFLLKAFHKYKFALEYLKFNLLNEARE